ncbi:dienelactone hydrolase family protein [Acidobacteria bacterium AH-259-O06]|nr:dienelactone hydrolase family protein [Acidobacteria bacterium AH-259-O06]
MRIAAAVLLAFISGGEVLLLAQTTAVEEGKGFLHRGAAAEAFAELLKIPLQPPDVSVRVRGKEEDEGLITEDVSWASLDGERPTAFVIRPADAKARLPAIVCLHGSSGSRESMCTKKFGIGPWTRPGRQSSHTRLLGWARELSRHGYLTLALTQRGLDTRTPDTNDQAKDLLVRGRTLMGAIVYEIRQAVTYLQQREDVDSRKIGMTGMSFGGITTFYSWLVDERIGAAAPICGGVGSVDVFLRRGSRRYHGFYWWIPDMLTRGDQGDFAAAMAPRPLMLWAPLHDIGMPREGVDRFLEVVQPAYAKAGAPGALVVHRPPGEHSFSLEAFQAMKSFFDRHLEPR